MPGSHDLTGGESHIMHTASPSKRPRVRDQLRCRWRLAKSGGLSTVTTGSRAAGADRNAVVDRLTAAHAEGHLDIHEFEERVSFALVSKTYGTANSLLVSMLGVPIWAMDPSDR